ncbi:hypothetical protein BH10PSE19_BH10PSE19_06000 [soil metagenome]
MNKIIQFFIINIFVIFSHSAAAKDSPFSSQINTSGEKVVIFSPKAKAWAAYDREGDLVRWGRASGGSDWCNDIHRPCHTPAGVFRVYSIGDKSCISNRFPLPKGGAPMPECMHFNGPYALHGSNDVPNHNASHGCVRLPVHDAKWLNHNFVNIGTKVIVKPYGASSSRHVSRSNHYRYSSRYNDQSQVNYSDRNIVTEHSIGPVY